jgi:hypothetical protein
MENWHTVIVGPLTGRKVDAKPGTWVKRVFTLKETPDGRDCECHSVNRKPINMIHRVVSKRLDQLNI